jgi:hypothetical protein
MLCPKCNATLKEGAKFCHICGFNSMEMPVNPPVQQQYQTQVQPQYQTPVQPSVDHSFTDSKFFTFIHPYLKQIDNGKFFRNPFSWLYILIAAANILFPLYMLYTAIDNNILDLPAKYSITFFLTWSVIAFAGWLSFQLWWDRKSKVVRTSGSTDDFVATPVFSHFIQTLGEWLGSWIGAVGFLITLFGFIFLGDDAKDLNREIGLKFISSGPIFLLLFPVIGFFIVVFTRFLAEMFRALASTANNTKKIATNTEKDLF